MIINTDLIYPVGSIYLSAKPTNPGTLFGGTWTQIKGRYLYAVNATSGNKGKDSLSTYTGTGAQSHTLTIEEMPNHRHFDLLATGLKIGLKNSSGDGLSFDYSSGSRGTQIYTGDTGGSQGHTHNIAYVDVYMWQRTA